MEYCKGCKAKTPDARKVVEIVSGTEDVDCVTPESAANQCGVGASDAQAALNCLFNREFNECIGEELYTGNVDVIQGEN